MRIEKIEWLNYRPYSDNRMEFPEGKPTVVINWVNGVGKTSFLNSIYWCLYGEEIFPVRRFIPNGESVKEASRKGERSLDVRVSITFKTRSGESINLVRTHGYKVDGVNEVQAIGMSVLEGTLSKHEAAGYSPIGDAQDWVAKMFPRRLSPHFFIDGQNLQNLSVDAAPRNEAIASIAALDALQKEIDHLEVVSSEISGELRKASKRKSDGDSGSGSEALSNKIETISVLIDGLEKGQREFREKHGDPDLLEQENKKVSEAVAQLNKIREERNTAIRQRSESSNSVTEGFSTLPEALLLPEIQALIDEAEDQHEGIFSRDQIKAILNSGSCVCGTQLSKDTKAADHLEQLLSGMNPNSPLAQVDRKVLRTVNSTALQSTGALIQSWRAYRSHDKRIRDIDKELRTFKTQNESLLESDLAQASPQEILNHIGMYRQAEVQIQTLAGQRQELLDQLEQIKKEALEEAIDSDDPRAKLQKQLRFIDHAFAQARMIHQNGMENVRSRLSDVFENLFRKMTADESKNFETVMLDSDLKVKVLDKDGQERQGGFSAGWALVAAFAFAYSLNELTSFELPLVVDTPFGPLSKDRKQLLAETLAKATRDPSARDRQVIILMTDTEADHGVSEAFTGPHTQWFRGKYDQSSQQIKFEMDR